MSVNVKKEAEELMEKSIAVFEQKARIIAMGYSVLFFDSLHVSAKGKSSGELRNFALVKTVSDKPNEFIIELLGSETSMLEPIKASLSAHGIVEKFGARGAKLVLPVGFAQRDAFQKVLIEKREDCKKQIRSIRDDLRKLHCSSKKKSDQELRNEKEIDTATNNANKKIDDIYAASARKIEKL